MGIIVDTLDQGCSYALFPDMNHSTDLLQLQLQVIKSQHKQQNLIKKVHGM